MCLKGLNWVPAVTVGLGIECAWDVRLDSARKHHWVQGSSLQSSASLLPYRGIVACRLLRFTRGMDGPLLPLDEHSLMAASLKADGPVWGVSFTSLQLALAGHSSGCLALLSCPHDGAPRGWNVCHLFYFQIKVDDLPIKSKNSLLMMSGGIWRKCCKSDISSTLSEITKGKRDLSPPFFCMSSDKK